MKSYRIVSQLLGGLLMAQAYQFATAADAVPSGLAVESFFKDPALSFVKLSPKGQHVAMLVRNDDGKQLLAVRDTANLNNVTVPTSASGNNQIVSVRWINESRIGFTVKSLRNEFQSNWDEYAVDIEGTRLVQLISGSWEHHQDILGTNIKSRTLTADYGFHGVTYDGSDDIIVEKYTWNNTDRHNPDHSRLYRLNTKTLKVSELFQGSQPGGTRRWLTDANGVPRITTAIAKGRCITSYRSTATGGWSEMANEDCFGGKKFTPRFFDGDDTLYVTSDYKGTSALYRYDIKTMHMDTEPFVSINGFDFSGGAEFERPSGKVMGIHLYSDAAGTVWLNPTMKQMQAKVDALLTHTNNTINCAADCLGAPVVLVTGASDRQPTQYYVYTPATGAIIGLGGTHPAIKEAEMGVRSFHHFAARDGLSIPVYVTTPAVKATGPRPAVVLVHGGPNVRGGRWEWEAQAQFLASRGYLVIEADYRGSTGYGFKHFQAGWKQWGQSMQDDLADAAQWAVAKGWADPQRIALVGASYGGYATLMGLIKNPELFRCGVEWAGVTDISLMFNTPESDASTESLNYGMRTLIGDPEKDAAMFATYSPLLNAARLKQPLLMAHGAEDLRVPLVHATRFRDAVQQNNPHVESLVYNNEGHGWRHEEDNIDFWKHVEVFLDKNLKSAR